MAALADLIRWLVAFSVTGFWPFVAVVTVLVFTVAGIAGAASFTPIRIHITREIVDDD